MAPKKKPVAPVTTLDGINEDLRILARPVKDLIQDPRNCNTHDRRSIETLKASLLRFGQTRPIKADTDGLVVAGNGLLMAAIELGWTHIAVSVKEFADEHERTAYALVDNRSAQLSALDYQMVAESLQQMSAADVAIGDLGWTEQELFPLLQARWSQPETTGDDGGLAVPRVASEQQHQSILLTQQQYAIFAEAANLVRAEKGDTLSLADVAVALAQAYQASRKQ